MKALDCGMCGRAVCNCYEDLAGQALSCQRFVIEEAGLLLENPENKLRETRTPGQWEYHQNFTRPAKTSLQINNALTSGLLPDWSHGIDG